MAKTVITPLHWNMIVDGIHEGSCVPFLGAAANVSNAKLNYKGLPLGGDVALRLIEMMIGTKVERVEDLARVVKISKQLKQVGLDKDLARLGLENLPRVALHVEVQSQLKRGYLVEKLQDILPEDQCEPSKLLCTLAQLPFSLIVTTNYDRLLERALDEVLQESLSIKVEHLKEPQRLALELKAAGDPLAQYLKSKFSPATRKRLDAYDGLTSPSKALRKALAREINKVVNGDSLYEENRFEKVDLTDETWDLIDKNPDGKDRLRLNRLLLEDAYPIEKVKSRKPYEVVVQPMDGFKGEEKKKHWGGGPADDILVVYKIHGSFHDGKQGTTDKKSDLIITEEDYIRFLTALGNKDEGVPPYVTSKMVRGRKFPFI